MHVLLLPCWYATVDQPTVAPFFRDYALALRRSGSKWASVMWRRVAFARWG